MRHDHPLRLKRVHVRHQRTKVQVKLDVLLERVRLCYQEIGSPACWNERLRPSCIASIRDDFSYACNAQGQRRITTGMLNTVRGHGDFTQRGRLLEGELAYFQEKSLLHLGRTRKEDLHRCCNSFLCAGWPRDQQGMGPFADQLGIEHKKGDSPEVITMEVGEQDQVNGIGIYSEAAHCDQCSRTAID